MTELSAKHKIVLICEDVPVSQGEQAAIDITNEFKERPWHRNVKCLWDGSSLNLLAENDYDDKGLALMDEFSDAITAYVRDTFDGDMRIVSVTKISVNKSHE